MSGSTSDVSVKQRILDELNRVPEDALTQVLEYVQSRTVNNPETSDGSYASSDEVWQAYKASEEEDEEVYRRLADS